MADECETEFIPSTYPFRMYFVGVSYRICSIVLTHYNIHYESEYFLNGLKKYMNNLVWLIGIEMEKCLSEYGKEHTNEYG